ncbi:hypothetical protein [Mycolicibacterium mageritense]|uniref:Alpha/beta hydrolase n=1 Tax=Mycolicibacterium mageritense TaxID=53462 RepID=A0AAI8XME8_MYCME|nr:hypothetical protein [Mycolicibacterium mageritense]BDY30564.1 hypothetical protein hbim_04508 [Mycolicibacterium mageritense]CDO19829.1 hydrolase, alpha/beta hydrolase fold family protein [Mycolicibacterium mageritense DSM 44476 = CIP 104973]
MPTPLTRWRGRLPNAKAILYSDAGHGFLFQHIEDFAAGVVTFLA